MGVVCKDGIILGTEKIVVSKMMVSRTNKRIYSFTKWLASVVNGIIPDGRAIETITNQSREFKTQIQIG